MTILLCGFTAFIVAFLVALGVYVYVVHRGIDNNGPFTPKVAGAIMILDCR